MFTLPRFNPMGRLAAGLLAVLLGLATLTPGSARANDDEVVRVIVDLADVIFHGGHPYYRHGGYGYDNRLVVVHDRYGRPTYYRHVPRSHHRQGPPYGRAHGYWKKHRGNNQHRVTCDRYGRCVSRYYDPRYDRRHYDAGYGYHDRYRDRYGYQDRYRDRYRYWDGYRWRYYGD